MGYVLVMSNRPNHPTHADDATDTRSNDMPACPVCGHSTRRESCKPLRHRDHYHAEPTVLTVQFAVTVRPDLAHLGAEGIAQAMLCALEVGLEGAEDAGVVAPDVADVALVFVDNADPSPEV